MYENYFEFPIVLMLNTSELSSDLGIDQPYVIASAEEPYYKYSGIIERWLPTSESRSKAEDGDFEACVVKFEEQNYLVPMNKDTFKKRLKKFFEKLKEAEDNSKRQEEENVEIPIQIIGSFDQLKDLLNGNKEDNV